jgi:cytochrome b subunit of formate dehydrogenase
MQIDTGVIIAAVACAIFYGRIAFLRWKKRNIAKAEALASMKKGAAKPKKLQIPSEADKYKPPYKITSWPLLILGMILMCIGIMLRTQILFPPELFDFYWVPVLLGVVLWAFCFTI